VAEVFERCAGSAVRPPNVVNAFIEGVGARATVRFRERLRGGEGWLAVIAIGWARACDR